MRGLLVFLVACNSAAPLPLIVEADAPVPSTECQIENVLTTFVGSANPKDCGRLAIDPDDAPFTTAHDCAVAAESSRQPYLVEWQVQGADSRVATAYVGIEMASGWASHRLFYDGDPSGGGGDNNPVTTIWRCDTFTDQGACSDIHTTLCLACDLPVFVERGDARSPST